MIFMTLYEFCFFSAFKHLFMLLFFNLFLSDYLIFYHWNYMKGSIE